ncbi:MAG: ABC transporter permease, partial [Chloroflexi bacterium]|nr:ABC transporter permease [Chloroflexota bacterium]MBM4451586.1 ABC transporter permease [Chloroflexota bacterium]
MEEIWNGFVKAIQLIVTLDPEVMEITGRSLAIAAASCLLATAICIPLGSLIHFNRFAG